MSSLWFSSLVYGTKRAVMRLKMESIRLNPYFISYYCEIGRKLNNLYCNIIEKRSLAWVILTYFFLTTNIRHVSLTIQ